MMCKIQPRRAFQFRHCSTYVIVSMATKHSALSFLIWRCHYDSLLIFVLLKINFEVECASYLRHLAPNTRKIIYSGKLAVYLKIFEDTVIFSWRWYCLILLYVSDFNTAYIQRFVGILSNWNFKPVWCRLR